jgi:pimeloyl-ACP methyl ester carboxylesterase
MSRLGKIFAAAGALYVGGSVLGGVLLAEMQLHPPRLPLRHTATFAEQVHRDYGSELKDVSIQAADGAVLRGWYVKPKKDNGDAVILLHGVGDNREGVAGYARIFLSRGYRVLLPDARAHGVSGGEIATYGLKESDDIHRWIDWLETDQPKCVYGLGESMGAALLLQSLKKESRFCTVVAEASFARFDEVAPERAAGYTGMPFWFGRTIERPVIAAAMEYTRLRYGLDFRNASPADALAHSNVPVLLIAGTSDRNILPHHSQELARIDPHAQLWMVEGAGHTGAWSTDPAGFESRVLGFFAEHRR